MKAHTLLITTRSYRLNDLISTLTDVYSESSAPAEDPRGAVAFVVAADQYDVAAIALRKAGFDFQALPPVAEPEDPRALGERIPRVITNRTRKLGNREQILLEHLVDGFGNKEIATEMAVSEAVVKGLLQRLFRRFGVRTRSQLVRIALEQAWEQSALTQFALVSSAAQPK